MTLIDRLSKLDRPDREVDVLIENALGLAQFKRVECGHGDSDYVRHNVQPYTASVDAAIALAERVLPGWNWRVGRTELYPNGWSYVHKYDPSNCDRTDEAACADGKAANPAIALCIAILRAKEASHGE